MTMTKYRLTRRGALGLIGGSALVAVPGARVSAQTLDKVSYQTNWRAQAEHGGFYLAAANGIYKKYGIDAEIRPGGPQQNPSQLLLGGRVDMIMSNSFEAIRYAQENIPFLCIASIFQKDPQVIISHPGVGNDSLAALKGKPILVGAAGRTSYWPFLKAKFGLHRRADPALHLQHGAVPGRQDDLAAGLPVVGALRHPEAGRGHAGGPSHRRCRLRELQHDDQRSPARWSTRRRTWSSASSPPRWRAGPAYMKGQDVAAANAQILKDNPDMDRGEDRLRGQGDERQRHRASLAMRRRSASAP